MTLPWIVLHLALWAVVLGLAVVVLGLLRRIGPVLEAAERNLRTTPTLPADLGGLAPGTEVPDFAVTTAPDGARRRFKELLGDGIVVLFVQEECPACTGLLSGLAADADALAGTRLLVVADAAEAAELNGLANAARISVAAQHGDVSQAFDQRAFPQAFAVDAAGLVVAQLVPSTIDDLTRLGDRLRDRHRNDSPMPTERGGSP